MWMKSCDPMLWCQISSPDIKKRRSGIPRSLFLVEILFWKSPFRCRARKKLFLHSLAYWKNQKLNWTIARLFANSEDRVIKLFDLKKFKDRVIRLLLGDSKSRCIRHSPARLFKILKVDLVRFPAITKNSMEFSCSTPSSRVGDANAHEHDCLITIFNLIIR